MTGTLSFYFWGERTSAITSSKANGSLSYREAGVDIDAGDRLVARIKPMAAATTRPGVLSGLGGFGALFDPLAAGYDDPILVSATDGVGTKLKIAQASGRHDTVGIDLVAMCVNDLVVQGAEPLFFLDYFASGRLDEDTAANVIAGIAAGCAEAGAALIGGETAEMPGMYGDGEYDLAGFSVGAVNRDALLPKPDLKAGNVVIGLVSSGLHANGFSLVRKVIEREGLAYTDPAPFADGPTLADALLTPTRIYVDSCRAAIGAGGVKALAHITGGGLIENIPRVVPEGLAVALYAKSWDLPPVIAWLAEKGGLARREMARTFNCGIGMVCIADPDRAAELIAIFENSGETAIPIGEVTELPAGETERVTIHNLEDAW